MPTYTDQDIQDLLAEFDITVPDLSSRINAVEGKIITVATGADVTDYGQVELIAKLESDAAEGRANTYTDDRLTAAGIDILAQANSDSQSKYDAIKSITKAYTDGLVTNVEEAAAITATAKAELAELNAKAYADGIVTDSEAAQIAASEARAELAETLAKAYADGIVTDAEANAIFEAEIKAQALADAALIAAKDYADSISFGDISIEQLDDNLASIIDSASGYNKAVAELQADMTEAQIRDIYQLGKDSEVLIDLNSKSVEIASANSSIIDLDILTSTQATRITQLNTSVNNSYSYARDYTNTSVGYWSGNTWIDGPISESIRSMGVTLGDGSSASITNIAQAFQNENGNLVAQGGMLTDVKGRVNGFMTHNNGKTSQFDILSSSVRFGEYSNGNPNTGTFEAYLYSDSSGLNIKGNIEADSLVVPTGNGIIQVSTSSGTDGMGFSTYVSGAKTNGFTVYSDGRVIVTNHRNDATYAVKIARSSLAGTKSYSIYADRYAGGIYSGDGFHAGYGKVSTVSGDIYSSSGDIKTNSGTIETNLGSFYTSNGDYTTFSGYFRSPNTSIVNFTGGHPYLISKNIGININGMLVSGTSLESKTNISSVLGYAKLASEPRDCGCIGPVSNIEKLARSPESHSLYGLTVERERELKTSHSIAIVNAVGDGQMWVCSETGDIPKDKWLCSSSTPGHAMLQTDEETGLYEKYFTDYTVAKSREEVIWEDEPNDTKLIAVYYKGG